MKIQGMGSHYFAVVDDKGCTVAIVDLYTDPMNPSISYTKTITLHDSKIVTLVAEEEIHKRGKP